MTSTELGLCQIQRREMEARNAAYAQGYGSEIDAWHAPEFDALKAAIGDCRGLSILDAGCGVGKFSAAVQDAKTVVGIDLALEGLRRFKMPIGPTTYLVQADGTRMPIRAGTFDMVLCCQVLSHLPTPELRVRLLDQFVSVLKPQGTLIVTAMHYNFRYRQKGLPKHEAPNGLFSYRFEADELRSLLEGRFNIHALHGYWIYLPKTYRLFMALGHQSAHWDRFWRRFPLSLKYGKFLMAICSTA